MTNEPVARDLADCYRNRAREYDAVYRKPERQHDLAELKQLVPAMTAGRRVLEIAAGTGYGVRVHRARVLLAGVRRARRSRLILGL